MFFRPSFCLGSLTFRALGSWHRRSDAVLTARSVLSRSLSGLHLERRAVRPPRHGLDVGAQEGLLDPFAPLIEPGAFWALQYHLAETSLESSVPSFRVTIPTA